MHEMRPRARCQLNPAVTAERPLSIYVYGVGVHGGTAPATQWETLSWLHRLGFRTNPDAQRLESIEEVAEACAAWESRRGELGYEIDGIVKVDSRSRRLSAPCTDDRGSPARTSGRRPRRHAAARIHVRVGRTGVLNPLAELEPVQVGGVTVSSATLHNEDDIRRKDIRVGDMVVVQRAGDVIPQVVGPAGEHEPGTKPWRMPKRCPLCRAEIVKPEGEVMHCARTACVPRVAWRRSTTGSGRRWTSRTWREDGQEALGRGPVRSPPDLYRVTTEQLEALEGYAEISAARAIACPSTLQEQPFSRVRALRAEHSEGGLGDRAQSRLALRLGRRA